MANPSALRAHAPKTGGDDRQDCDLRLWAGRTRDRGAASRGRPRADRRAAACAAGPAEGSGVRALRRARRRSRRQGRAREPSRSWSRSALPISASSGARPGRRRSPISSPPARRPAREWCSSTISTCTGRRPRRLSRPCRLPILAGSRPRARRRPASGWRPPPRARRASPPCARPTSTGPASAIRISAIRRSASSRRGKPAVFIGSPDVLHDYAYVPDIARAATTLLAAPDSRLRPGLARSLRAHPHDPRHSQDRRRDARREASHQRHAGLDAGHERDVLAVPAELIEMRFQWDRPYHVDARQIRERVLVGRDAVRDRRPRDGAGVPRRVQEEAVKEACGFARASTFSTP